MNTKKVISIIGFLFLLSANNIIAQSEDSIASKPGFKFASIKATRQTVDSIVVYGTLTSPPYSQLTISKTRFKRDKEGNNLIEERFGLDANNNLVPKTKNINTFATYGQIAEKIILDWDESSKSYITKSKTDYYYPLNDICFATKYIKKNNTWVVSDSLKTITTYNANQEPLEIITYTYQNGKWVDSLKRTNSFDEHNRIAERSYYTYKPEEKSWKNIFKKTYQYKDDNKSGTIITIDLNGSMPKEKNTDTTPSGLSVTTNSSFTYKMLVRKTLPIIEMVIETAPTAESTEKAKRTNNNHEAKDLGFYVNAGEEGASVSIFNINGDLLLTKEITGTSFIKMNSLGKGNFLVKIMIDENTVTRKIVIK